MKKLITTAILCAFLLSAFSGCDKVYNSTRDNQNNDIEAPNTTSKEQNEADTSSLPNTDEIFQNAEALEKYKKALELLEAGDLYGAYDVFLEIKDFRDVRGYLERFSFKYGAKITQVPTYSNTLYCEYDEYGRMTYEMGFSSYSKSKSYTVYDYDSRGNVTRMVEHSEYSDRDQVTTYEYDEDGNLIREINPNCYVTTLEYDAHGRVTRVYGAYQETTYLYDEEGNLLKKEWSSYDGSSSITSYEYDQSKNCTKVHHEYEYTYDDEQTAGWNLTFHTYDEKGNRIKSECEQSNGYCYSSEYEYDDYGNKTKESYHGPFGVTIHTWKYDENSNVTEYSRKSDEMHYVNTYEYDAFSNCIRITETNVPSKQTYVYLYEYDSYGNLLKEHQNKGTLSTEDDITFSYVGYELYYDPYPAWELPEDIGAKG